MSETKRCPDREHAWALPSCMSGDGPYCSVCGIGLYDSQQPSAEPQICPQCGSRNKDLRGKVDSGYTVGVSFKRCGHPWHGEVAQATAGETKAPRVNCGCEDCKFAKALAASPSTILTEHDAKVRRETVEECAKLFSERFGVDMEKVKREISK